MNKFKAGDKVKRIASVHDGMKVGDIAVVKYVENVWNIYLDGYEFAHDPANFELVTSADEKESTSAWLKENKWFIRTGSPEKSKLVQEWLFQHGCEWLYGKTVQSDFKDQLLTNTNCGGYKEKYIMFSTDGNKTNAQEITLEFETIVKSVKLPEAPKPTEQESQQELRIIELERIINDAKNKIEELKLIK